MNTCTNCGNEIALFDAKLKIKGGIICAACENKLLQSLGYHIPPTISEKFKLNSMPLSTVKDKVDNFVLPTFDPDIARQDEEDIPEPVKFSSERAIKVDGIEADFVSQKLMLRPSILSKKRLMNFYDITSYRPYVQGKEVTKHHGVARALTGGVLFGGAGAIVGAVTGGKRYSEVSSVGVNVYLADGQSVEFSFIDSKTKADSWVAQGAQKRVEELSVLLDRIIDASRNQQSVSDNIGGSSDTSVADEIKQYKELLDSEIITQDEFDKKRHNY